MILRRYGADALRLFILFASPPDKEFAWTGGRASRAATASCCASGAWSTRTSTSSRTRRPLPAGRGRAASSWSRKTHQTDPQGDRRHRRPLPPQHGHQLDHGALQPGPQGARRPAALARRSGGPAAGPRIHHPAALALRAPHGRGALGEDRAPRACSCSRPGPPTTRPWPARRWPRSSSRSTARSGTGSRPRPTCPRPSSRRPPWPCPRSRRPWAASRRARSSRSATSSSAS
ncbi:MAG: hypothetical protein MZV64_49490 [Ignavibacteriales bacterium]|nr:hypothetical protein [Ignavibacteriales bacterium]